MTYVMGIDPGATGGIAFVSDSREFAEVFEGGSVDADVVDRIRSFVAKSMPRICVVERVASFPGQGSSSTFTFGKRYGVIRGALLAMGVPFIDVPAQTWQKELGLTIAPSPVKGESEKDKKSRLAKRRKDQKCRGYELARNLFPTADITKEIADGILLAEYGIRAIPSLSR